MGNGTTLTTKMLGVSKTAFGVLFFSALGISAYDPEARIKEFPEFNVEVTDESENCTQKAAWGDTVEISHTGYYGEQKIDATTDQPLKVTLGSLTVLEGMELGMIDQCVGETRKVTIPGPLGFDREIYRRDPKRQPPVPMGESVAYEITLEKILPPPPAWQKALELATSGQFWRVAGVVILLVTMTWLVYSVLKPKPVKERKSSKAAKK